MKQHDPDFVALCAEAQALVDEMTPGEVALRLSSESNLLMVDVREDHEVSSGRCEGAVHLARGILERDIAKTVTRKDQPIVLYCGGGFRSTLAAVSLSGVRPIWSLSRKLEVS